MKALEYPLSIPALQSSKLNATGYPAGPTEKVTLNLKTGQRWIPSGLIAHGHREFGFDRSVSFQDLNPNFLYVTSWLDRESYMKLHDTSTDVHIPSIPKTLRDIDFRVVKGWRKGLLMPGDYVKISLDGIGPRKNRDIADKVGKIVGRYNDDHQSWYYAQFTNPNICRRAPAAHWEVQRLHKLGPGGIGFAHNPKGLGYLK